MNSSTKNKLLVGLVLLLVVANAATIAFFWFGRHKNQPPAKGSARDFLVNQLKLDAKQTAQYDELIKEHRSNAEQLRIKTKDAKEAFFHLLREPVITDSAKSAAAKAVSVNTEALDLLTLEHFQKVRALCTPDQQRRFDDIIYEVVRMMGQPRPPGGPGPGAGHPPPRPE